MYVCMYVCMYVGMYVWKNTCMYLKEGVITTNPRSMTWRPLLPLPLPRSTPLLALLLLVLLPSARPFPLPPPAAARAARPAAPRRAGMEGGDAPPAEGAAATREEEAPPRGDRKARKKQAKAARRATRAGEQPESEGRKACTLPDCGTPSDLLVRCQVDASGKWHMVCGKCWKRVSGGVTDGSPDHPYYRYGGLWKNRKANKAR